MPRVFPNKARGFFVVIIRRITTTIFLVSGGPLLTYYRQDFFRLSKCLKNNNLQKYCCKYSLQNNVTFNN